ncbi:MAG: ExbD/TolR family protein [Qingshengfaniella sp.]
MSLRCQTVRPARENTIALINIVFLMLIFFLVAGQLAPPLDPDLTPAQSAQEDQAPPPDAAMLMADGRLRMAGQDVTPEDLVAARGMAPVRIVPDREVPATALLGVAGALHRAGAAEVVLVVERAP